MKRWLPVVVPLLLLASLGFAQDLPARVAVTDRGVTTRVPGQGAPAHVIGLTQINHQVNLDTGKVDYGLLYVACADPKDPKGAIPGEGYIGMPGPCSCNWYHGGFFDLEINGRSLGRTMIDSLTVRSVADRGYCDFVFDAPMAAVRVRFVAKAGGDCLYAQVLLEPKETIKSVRLTTRCYPSAFVSNSDRHVLTATRDLGQGEKAELDGPTEWWTLYYDSLYDQGYQSPQAKGVGPCAMLWQPSEVAKAGFTVGGYGIDTVFTLQPTLRDFRFVFFDYAGTKNAAAMADLRGRADNLLKQLAAFEFTDPSLTAWDLPQRQEEVKRMLAMVPEDTTTAAKYAAWSEALTQQLKVVQSGGAGGIMAESQAAKTISDWEQGLPELKLKALLRDI